MLVMPACSTGWFWHCLARETGKIGHLYSPGSQRGPWPWFPYALDNGAFSCWNMADNTFSEDKWESVESEWKRLLLWCQCVRQKPLWAIVPDVPGNAGATIEKWGAYCGFVEQSGIPLAVAVQNGMNPDTVRALRPLPAVIAVGGTTDWKWETAEMWCREFPRVHVLRCNAPEKLAFLESIGCESTDGTGWNRGDRKQTKGLEDWARKKPTRTIEPLHPFVCRSPKTDQLSFA